MERWYPALWGNVDPIKNGPDERIEANKNTGAVGIN
jgi:hypothetical protein